jgi:putative transposase
MVVAPLIGVSRNGDLHARHLEELCRCLRRYRRIHVIGNNAQIYDCAAVNQVLVRHASRLPGHFLPKYASKCSPVERGWWHLRNAITRNSRCPTLEELISFVFAWLDGSQFAMADSICRERYEARTKTTAA